MRREVARLPLPDHLDPPVRKGDLMRQVEKYFFPLYNGLDPNKFRDHLASVGNEDALTLNHMFDRHIAVGMIKAAAAEAGDSVVAEAKDGLIYQCIVRLMRTNNLGLKIRRIKYRQQFQQAAE